MILQNNLSMKMGKVDNYIPEDVGIFLPFFLLPIHRYSALLQISLRLGIHAAVLCYTQDWGEAELYGTSLSVVSTLFGVKAVPVILSHCKWCSGIMQNDVP